MLSGVDNEEVDVGQPTSHLRRVPQGGQGAIDVSLPTTGQSRARGRSAKLSLLTSTGAPGGSSTQTVIETMDGEWELEVGGRDIVYRSATRQPYIGELNIFSPHVSQYCASQTMQLTDVVSGLSKRMCELDQRQTDVESVHGERAVV